MAEFNLIKQIKEFHSKLSNVQKLFFWGLPIIIILGLIILFANATPEKEYRVLFSDLSNSDAAGITQSLKEKKIPYKLENAGTTILVPEEQVFETRNTLVAEGLPSNSVVGYELFDKTNLGMSEFVQQVNYRRALEGELSRTITSIDEVQSARVHIVIPEKALFIKDQKEPTASVTLQLKSGRNLNSASVQGIQTLIASSVEGLSNENVTIIDFRGRMISEVPLDLNTVAGLTAQQLEQQKRVEFYLSNKVQNLLNNTLGIDNSTVQVNADLDFTKIEQTITDYDPERQAVRSEQNINEVSVSHDSLSYPAVNMSKEQSNVIQNYEIRSSVEHIVHQVGTIKRLSVSALVNGKYEVVESEGGLKELVYTPRSVEEMEQLQQIVENAVGYNPERNDRISVLNVPFDTVAQTFDLEPRIDTPWWQNKELQLLGFMILLMLVTLFFMIRILKNKFVKEQVRIALSLPAKVKVDDDDDDEDEEEQPLEELDFGDDLLLLPAELPDQLLLDTDISTESEDKIESKPEEELEKISVTERAKAKLAYTDTSELSEEAVMKLEIKNKVENFMDAQTDDAIKIIRVFLAQDLDLPSSSE